MKELEEETRQLLLQMKKKNWDKIIIENKGNGIIVIHKEKKEKE